MKWLTATDLALQLNRQTESNYIFDLRSSSTTEPSPTLGTQLAQLNPGKAIDNTLANFREVVTSGPGIALLALILGMFWISWKKRTH